MIDFRVRPAAVRAGEELDVAKLGRFLNSHFSDGDDDLCVEQFPNGHSNLTYSIHLGHRELVLRRPPLGSKVKSAHDMSREFRVLSKLHAAYPLAPKVLAYCDDLTVLGAPFYVMDPIHGVIIRKDPPAGLEFPETTAKCLSESFVDNLANLHRLDYSEIGLGDLGRPEGYLERQVKGWTERYYGSKTHELPEVERLTAWLSQNMPPSHNAALLHNDYKYDNVVLNPLDITNIVGLLDWEMSTVGDPLTDLGTALAYWVDAQDPDELQDVRWGPTTYAGSMTRSQIVQRYAQKTGSDVVNIAFYLVFARFKVAVIVQQIYYRYHQGLTKDERFAAMPRLIDILLRSAWQCAQTGSI